MHPIGSMASLDDGLSFIATGQYGSEYDPMGDEYLLIVLCDDCLFSEGRKGHVLQCFQARTPKPPDRRKIWNPDDNPYEMED